ncbi:MAG: hypothetical protein D3922_00930 [Candidatus Electrothrix sp. AR1]|nr:hypothetical protein [Candidatus Electrothrix sp. AR1]
MNDQKIFNLYVAQSENVRELWKAKESLVKDLNFNIRKGEDYQVTIKTKFLALLYSAWSEAQFTQIVFTPNGFTYSENRRILRYKKKNGIGKAWKLMLEDAMRKVGDVATRGDLNNRLRKLINISKDYIDEPSQLRNKIAHGEWINALNSKITATNPSVSTVLRRLDPVLVEKRFEVHRFLGYIVRDLIQSPKAGFHKHYWTNIVNLEQYMKKTETWNLQTKKSKLIQKPLSYNA